MQYNSIWSDTYYTTTADTLTYQILLDDRVIYSGKAVMMPGADELRININKVCRNYLSQDLESLISGSDSSIINEDAIHTFTLVDDEGNTLEVFCFLYDWSYDYKWTGGTSNVVLSQPINGHYVDGMMKLKSVIERQSSNHKVITYKSTGNYNTNVNCGDVLYYLNSRGGWDAFVFEGNTMKMDKLTTYTTDRVFDNNTLDFEKNRYVTEIKTSYTLNSGYLNDEQSRNFAKNLAETNIAYLHKIDEGWIKPVVITDSNISYQTYTTNGMKLSQYRLNVELSQSSIRR